MLHPFTARGTPSSHPSIHPSGSCPALPTTSVNDFALPHPSRVGFLPPKKRRRNRSSQGCRRGLGTTLAGARPVTSSGQGFTTPSRPTAQGDAPSAEDATGAFRDLSGKTDPSKPPESSGSPAPASPHLETAVRRVHRRDPSPGGAAERIPLTRASSEPPAAPREPPQTFSALEPPRRRRLRFPEGRACRPGSTHFTVSRESR